MKPQNLEWYGEYIWTDQSGTEHTVYFKHDDHDYAYNAGEHDSAYTFVDATTNETYTLGAAALRNVRKA
jgi:hypothetical protein